MRINPISTMVNYYNKFKPVFKADLNNNCVQMEEQPDMPTESELSVYDNDSGKDNSKKKIKKENYYYNKDIVEEIGLDGKTYFFLEEQKKQQGERIDDVRKKDPLGIYFQEIDKYPLLSAERELEVAKKAYDENDEEAKQLLINSNLRYVVTVAKRFLGRGLSLIDLIQEGNLGLVRAAQTYDYTRGFKFFSYADPWIESYMRNALSEKSRTVRIPVSMQNRVRKIKNAAAELARELKRAPTKQEIADKLGLPEEKITIALRTTKRLISMDDPVSSSDNSKKVIDFIPSEPNIFARETDELKEKQLDRVKNIFQQLSSMEQEVLILKFGLNGEPAKTLEEIANKYHVSRKKISTIERKALKYIREHYKMLV